MFNTDLGRKVLAWGRAAEQHEVSLRVGFDMASWVQGTYNNEFATQVEFSDDGFEDSDIMTPVEKMREGQCETAACVAGYVAILESPAGTMITDGGLVFPDGKYKNMALFANEKLGMPEDHRLYGESNATALHMLEWLCDHPEVVEADDFENQYLKERVAVTV